MMMTMMMIMYETTLVCCVYQQKPIEIDASHTCGIPGHGMLVHVLALI